MAPFSEKARDTSDRKTESRRLLSESKGTSVRLKWHTLAVAGSLGIFASFHPLLGDDNPPDVQKSTGDPASIISQISPRAAARRSAANPSAQDKNDSQGLSQELLRQAMVELDAKRFDTARRLARRAAALGVASGSVQPEQLLQEIDRLERGAKVVVQQAPPAAADTRTQLKSRAIELLDRGILALDQKRYDDAENCAQMAAQMHVAWDRYDYKPENLLEDVHREHSAGSASPARPIADLAYDPRPTTSAASPQPSEWSQRTNPPAPVTAAAAATAYSPTPAAFAAPAQPVSTAATASGGRTTAQAVLEQAMVDLRAGRDELARLRIEQALNSPCGVPSKFSGCQLRRLLRRCEPSRRTHSRRSCPGHPGLHSQHCHSHFLPRSPRSTKRRADLRFGVGRRAQADA